MVPPSSVTNTNMSVFALIVGAVPLGHFGELDQITVFVPPLASLKINPYAVFAGAFWNVIFAAEPLAVTIK